MLLKLEIQRDLHISAEPASSKKSTQKKKEKGEKKSPTHRFQKHLSPILRPNVFLQARRERVHVVDVLARLYHFLQGRLVRKLDRFEQVQRRWVHLVLVHHPMVRVVHGWGGRTGAGGAVEPGAGTGIRMAGGCWTAGTVATGGWTGAAMVWYAIGTKVWGMARTGC